MNIASLGVLSTFAAHRTASSAAGGTATSALVQSQPSVAALRYGDELDDIPDDDFGAYDIAGKIAPAPDSFTTAAPNGYEKFMPTREGFSSNNLALAITDPAAEPFSGGKTKAEVIDAPRKAIDTRYAQMRESGKPFDYNSFEGADWNSAMGDLDRRALSAIRTDKSGTFTQQEKVMAASIMSNQQGLAMGLYAGPTWLASEYAAQFPSSASDHMAMGRAGALWLDKLSFEEKTDSADWMQQRAATERLYESGAQEQGITPEKLNSGFSFVEYLLEAHKELQALGASHDLSDTTSYEKANAALASYSNSEQTARTSLYI